jgi:hypothetical protein
MDAAARSRTMARIRVRVARLILVLRLPFGTFPVRHLSRTLRRFLFDL